MNPLSECQAEIRRLRNVVRDLEDELNNRKMYLLCEELERFDGIVSVFIHQASFDEQKLKDLLQEKINKDEYDFISDYGVEDASDTHFKTKWGNRGCVEYYILEQEII